MVTGFPGINLLGRTALSWTRNKKTSTVSFNLAGGFPAHLNYSTDKC